MTPEQKQALDDTAAERAEKLEQPTPPLTLESLHARLTAVENHPVITGNVPPAPSEPSELNHSTGESHPTPEVSQASSDTETGVSNG